MRSGLKRAPTLARVGRPSKADVATLPSLRAERSRTPFPRVTDSWTPPLARRRAGPAIITNLLPAFLCFA
jgi:hypothetical protein